MPIDSAAAPAPASPAASGPAGALFEGQVGAHYLLTVLAEADPRGLPGASIARVALQRAGEGHPLDDVIVYGVGQDGLDRTLEVQIKRTITFAPSDPVFRDVLHQLGHAIATLDRTNLRHHFAVATDKTSAKIAGPYQDVLRWARELETADVFMGRLGRRGVANDDMRTFVAAVRTHFAAAGCPSDDDTIWHALRRFQILTFDFDAPGSQSAELAIERARHVLHADDVPRAAALWKTLIETTIRVAASGGDLDRARLVAALADQDGFRVTGPRRSQAARETLAEEARLAAADLKGKIAGVSLARASRVAALRTAMDRGRYVEIRGGPGVGKSGLLGLLVEQTLAEARAVVLTPHRTIPGGWLAFKSALSVTTGPEELLADLASDGGGVLFIDSLDFVDDPAKRTTISDLVRAAAAVPGLHVVATARSTFDVDEPNWLPSDALAALGVAPPVLVDELTGDEVAELRATAPSLRALLADQQPARALARNLFRLSRLLEVDGSLDQLQTEVDLIERWWTTGDGVQLGRRDRARLLADLADAALAGRDPLDIRADTSTVDALVGSGSLRELVPDRVTFAHDVLREWAVAARLRDVPDQMSLLTLSLPAPTSLARGIELGARFALERAEDGRRWVDYLARLSVPSAHPSWRRWSLLASLRSEKAEALLDQAADELLATSGTLLRELIRTALAVESEPMADMIVRHGGDASAVPRSILAPVNGSWARLTRWLLRRRADLPLDVLGDVTELFQSLSVSMFVSDPLTPELASALADWLEEIEEAQDHSPFKPDPPRFADLRFHDLADLASDMRRAFLLMAARSPDRAKAYLRRQLARRNPEQTIRDIMKFRGALAQAAPAELVELTLFGLVPKPETRRRRQSDLRDDTFNFLDKDFLPASPAQGPFLELLNAAPDQGLLLIRELVAHAIRSRTRGIEPGEDGYTLALASGPRLFPWRHSYAWSRQMHDGYAVESGLMALEAWGHARIERGDPPEQVLADVLDPNGSPASFLLVAIDLIISHWPKTKAAAIPFAGSPELLSLDRERQTHDGMPNIDLFGFGSIGPKEPAGATRLEDLAKRPSRRFALEALLGTFALDDEHREAVRDLLTVAATQLGEPEGGDTFADPRFMARYALNVTNPANWLETPQGRAYVSPPEEARHLEALQRDRASQTLDFGVDAAIQNALEHPDQSSSELAAHAVAYAQRLQAEPSEEGEAARPRTHAIVSAALIVARDASDALLDDHEVWVRDVFADAFSSKPNVATSNFRDGIRFNPVAIATLGIIHLWHRGRGDPRSALLAVAGRDDVSAAHGIGAGLSLIGELEPRMIPALLRCALRAQVRADHRWNTPDEVKLVADEQHRTAVAQAIAAELGWMEGDAPEPTWPELPARLIHLRHPAAIGGNLPASSVRGRVRPLVQQLRSQTAAIWVRQLTRESEAERRAWILDFVKAYALWTAEANGAGLEQQAEIDGRSDAWNDAYVPLVAEACTRMSRDEAIAFVAAAIDVPDRSFFDIAEELVPALDQAFFNDRGLDLDTALALRTQIVGRMVQTTGWRREEDRTTMSVESRIGPAIAPLFFCRYSPFAETRCYLLPKGVDRVDTFFPLLTRMIADGSVPFTALLSMSLLEVSPRAEHLPFLLDSAEVWLRRQPTNSILWSDHGFGARVTRWLESVLGSDQALIRESAPLRPRIDGVLARLVQIGVAEAHQLERAVTTGQVGASAANPG
ncbi:MAG: hypothetical protein PGN25_06010 [Methylorubrum populi]